MKLGKLTAAVLGVTATVLTMGAANAQYIAVGSNAIYGNGVNVLSPGVGVVPNGGYGYNGYSPAYVAPVGGSYVATAPNGGTATGVNATVYGTPAPTAYTSVPVGTTPYSQVVGQLYDPVTEACYTRTDVYNYYTYDVFSGPGATSFVGRYTDGPYYQTSYESSYAGFCR